MDIFKKYEELKQEIEFKKFLRDNKEYYLVHIVVLEEENFCEFGFYNPKTDKITIFKTNPFSKGEEDDVFKQGKTITELKINKVKMNYEDAITEANNILKKEFSEEQIKKKIIILQHLSEQVWNMTFICVSLNIINIRINAETKEVIRKNKESLLSMAGLDKGS